MTEDPAADGPVATPSSTVTLPIRELVLFAAVILAALVLAGALAWPWAIATLALLVAWAMATADTVPAPSPASAATTPPPTATTLLTTIITDLPDAALILDGAGIAVAANTAAATIFPIAAGRPIAQITRAPELLHAVDATLGGSDTQSVELQLPPPRRRTLDVRVIPLGRDAASHHVDRSAPALLVILRDRTEHDDLSRMRADFVANASHELRTPLASLKGFIETLQGAARDDATARQKFLVIMQEQAARMSRLIDDLLSLSRVEMRAHVPPTGHVDLSSVVDEIATTLRPLAAAAGITLTATRAAGSTTVVGDRDELAQVVQNLIHNAIKYGRTGGTVAVALTRQADRLALAVTDDGIGIAPEHLPRLTERFYRVSAKDSRERGGTGLGLAIVKHIVSRHRGDLRITSTSGAGSTFTVTIPAATP
jgi:two-component system, OmpR family, phosphate regulon sensor histidine kinase PhoR